MNNFDSIWNNLKSLNEDIDSEWEEDTMQDLYERLKKYNPVLDDPEGRGIKDTLTVKVIVDRIPMWAEINAHKSNKGKEKILLWVAAGEEPGDFIIEKGIREVVSPNKVTPELLDKSFKNMYKVLSRKLGKKRLEELKSEV